MFNSLFAAVVRLAQKPPKMPGHSRRSGSPQPKTREAIHARRVRGAFSVCTESVIQCLSARIAEPKGSDSAQQSIVVLGQQKLLKERRLIGMTARIPKCDFVTAWPLGAPPALTVLSPSGHFFASIVESAAAKPEKSRPGCPLSSASPEFRIELFGRGPQHTGPVVALEAPRGTKPWSSAVGGGAFCPGKEELFVYVAEARKREGGDPDDGSNSINGEDKKADSLDAYEFRTHWGEQLVGQRKGRLVLTDFRKQRAQVLTPPESETACGQPRFLSDGSGIVCSVWDLEPYCLGLIYCMNRRSKVCLAQLPSPNKTEEGSADERKASEEPRVETLDCDWIELSGDEDFAAWSPTVLLDHPDADRNVQRIAFLALEKDKPETLPHMCAPRVKAVTLRRENAFSRWEVVERQTLAEAVSLPQGEETSLFSTGSVPYSGIYTDRLGPWVHKDFLFLNTFIGARRTVVILSAYGEGCFGELRLEGDSLRVKKGSPPENQQDLSCPGVSLFLHDVAPNWLLLESSALDTPPQLVLAKLEISCENSSAAVHTIFAGSLSLGGSADPQALLPWSPFAQLKAHLKKLEFQYLSGSRHTLLRWKESPRRDGQRALAVVLHGGPHSVSANMFSAEATFLTFLGFDVFAVNYRGSLGFGQEELLSLLGKAGRQDVDDVKEAVSDLIASDPDAYTPARTVVVGGSHGGFLTCHLIGQFPDLFAAASTRNPVTNLASMVVESDIPDWCAAEGLHRKFHPSFGLTENDIVALYKASPVAYAQHVKTPLLLGIGSADLRVPACQGIAFHKMLLGQGSSTRLLFYPDEDHRIDRPTCSEDYWINTALWFAAHTGTLDALNDDVLPACTL
ncbi:acylaminoacyl-peptidase, putative [Toxoplasma gondii ME49]|uniref:acylaminoacyl-peptidase n=4 Tax=Toxoplasma gondii TaxID=5811 RepID=B6KGU4_TOXGV|nr:acylaminoacyl-peptidase, putative [Toxoplasma gondii ME49]ESS34175.1 putative acylaminoacyl-peptidase [Toxoplasma gondii VEG]KFG46857.1 putative acylaminoacyl-peptidase [Toxoplasma gondii GAB2-2007-GAL-DOM2]KYF49350.1 putative acylaminoacyl-peptidase [Toxoplasma gondii ARI]EPT24889.1 acylaminoacyl-peptidase, putative [Toxoplasma gondii ME49]CEL78355.1 TPA: acylamino-acid-releasing enzyme, putative [Toxoplasma gondii VEG]|eukprot:XP_002367067.1 acylaminoacyl-peptidase, putative [Toxoplasma gondii ME49]